jgi:monofunctional biosynthetic peptidoglycan transglycosylase
MRRTLAAAGIIAGLFTLWLFAVWPPPWWYRTHWPRETAFMTRPQVRPLPGAAQARGRLYRPVPLDSIASDMQDAVMIGEDNNFLTHSGIDYLALAHALGYQRPSFSWRDPGQRRELLAVLPGAWSKRDRLRGASTITQQLAKNLYLSPSRNPLRKLKEAVITWRLEAALGKQRILELYLNVVELGADVWGVEAASRLYFQRSALSISREQAAALAGALPFPLRSNPQYRPGRMRWRQDLILRRMRGEQIEVPNVQDEEAPIEPPIPEPGLDTTAAARLADTVPPAPAESVSIPSGPSGGSIAPDSIP